MKVERASVLLEMEVNALAKCSPFTRDFANPPLSLKAMRKVAFTEGQVGVARRRGRVVGFIWARPMKPARMPFSTIYYMAVADDCQREGVGRDLVRWALARAKNNRLEAVCENANPASVFYARTGFRVIGEGHVGKNNRPYTRWALEVPR